MRRSGKKGKDVVGGWWCLGRVDVEVAKGDNLKIGVEGMEFFKVSCEGGEKGGARGVIGLMTFLVCVDI